MNLKLIPVTFTHRFALRKVIWRYI